MIGIAGGAGPAAGILLQQTILNQTKSHGRDQGHLPVTHISRPADIAERVSYLLPTEDGKPRGESPAIGMAKTFKLLRATAEASDEPLVVGVACCTFHAKRTWKEFCDLIEFDNLVHASPSVKCLNIVDETIHFIRQELPSCKKVGILSTTGTRIAGVFEDIEAAGFAITQVPESMQSEVQDTISNPEWGIKSCAPNTNQRCIDNCKKFARQLIADGADIIVLGCTELPFGFQASTSDEVPLFEGARLLDPMVPLARALIRETDPTKLKPLPT